MIPTGEEPQNPLDPEGLPEDVPANEGHVHCIVEVELPSVEECWEIPSDYRDFPLSVEKHGTWADIVDEYSDVVFIRPQELKPLGEYLIALHYVLERNQK